MPRYSAFISYSHRDEQAARWLHRRLENYRVPSRLVGSDGVHGPIPKRFRNIFRDREEFAAGGELKAEIENALDRSDALIVLCSPHAASSTYVNSEAAYFKSRDRSERIIPIILDGEPAHCFPPALIDGRERLGADFRQGKDERDNGLLKVLAGLLGVGLDTLVQRERAAQRWRFRAVIALAGVFAALAFAAVAFGISSEQQRIRSEANRLAAEARSASEQDQALLLAAAAHKTSGTDPARAALFSALARSPRLVRSAHTSGEARRISILPDGAIIFVADGERAIPTLIPEGADIGTQIPLNGFDQDLLDVAVADQGRAVVAQYADKIVFYSLDLSKRAITPKAELDAEDDAQFAASLDVAYATILHPDGRLDGFDVGSGKILDKDIVPFALGEPNRLRVSRNGKAVAVASDNAIWLRSNGRWRALLRSTPKPIAVLDIRFDEGGDLLVAAEGVDMNWSGSPDAAEKLSRLRCWQVDSGAPAPCPDVGILAEPTKLGPITNDTALLYHRDIRTGANVAESWTLSGDRWQSAVLRSDPTYLSSLESDRSGKRIFLGTIDGDLLEYSLSTFGAGSTAPVAGPPMLVDWQASGCRVISQAAGQIVSQDCAGKIHRSVKLEEGAEADVISTATPMIYSVRPDRSIVVWRTDLAVALATPPLPEGLKLGSLIAAFDARRGQLIVTSSEDSALFGYAASSAGWRKIGEAGFPIRVMAVAHDGGAIYVGGENEGSVEAIDTETGASRFKVRLPSGQFVQSIVPAPGDASIYVSVFTSRHSLFKLDASTGMLASDDLNRLSGPARVLAISPDLQYLMVRGIGLPDGRQAESDSRNFVGVELWDAKKLIPIGDAFRTRASDWLAAFSPDSQTLVLASDEPFETAQVPLDVESWIGSACAKAGRVLSSGERERFSVPGATACAPRKPASD